MSPKNKKDDVQDPAEPKKVENDVQTDHNPAGDGDGTSSAPVYDPDANDPEPTENRAADVGAQGNYPRWAGDHPDNDTE